MDTFSARRRAGFPFQHIALHMFAAAALDVGEDKLSLQCERPIPCECHQARWIIFLRRNRQIRQREIEFDAVE
jgi:hypothetical protein